MEETINTPVIQVEGDNQILIFLINTFYSALQVIAKFLILATNIFFTPFVWIYRFWAHAIDKSWQITKHIFLTFYQLLEIIPLCVEIWFWTVSICVSFLLFIKTTDEIIATIQNKIYKALKRILDILHALPLSPKHAAALNSILIKLPIFGKGRLPYPDFLFEDTFTNVNYRNGTISMTLPVPTEPSLQSGTETKPTETSSPATSDPTPSSDQSSTSSQIPTGQSSTSSQGPSGQNPIPSTTPIINEPKPETDQPIDLLSDQSQSGSEKSLSSL